MEEIKPEVIDITTIEKTPTISLNKEEKKAPPDTPTSKPSMNFGGGIELLMNDKRKTDGSTNRSTDIKLDDLNNLESELNALTVTPEKKNESRSSLFDKALHSESDNKGIKVMGIDSNKSKPELPEKKEDPFLNISKNTSDIGKATSSDIKIDNENKTWDGFNKFNNIPLDPDKDVKPEPKLSPEELLREKFSVLRKLEALEKKGAKLTKKYNMESSLDEMKGEYEMILADKAKANSCKFQGRMLMAAVTGIEFLNNRFDPFDIKLDGWSEQINENIDDYDEIFGELHEKYQSKATMAPELKLLFQLGGSAIMVHMTNTMFKSSMPGMDDIMKQNPELMQQFTQAAVNSMSDTNPGFSGFMNGMMGERDMPPPNVVDGPPPAPMATQQSKSQRSAPPSNRPDMRRARGDDDGINIQEQYANVGMEPPVRSRPSNKPSRPEMKGPRDIDDLLSGLKPKNINIQNKKDNNSKISIQELKEISDAKAPAHSKKRTRSEKNSISLDM